MEKKRRILSLILLAVFLPAFFASILHTHQEIIEISAECTECVHHLPHAGHVRAYDGGLSDCLLCHFLGLPFVISLAAVILPSAHRFDFLYSFLSRPFVTSVVRLGQTRAPPVFSAR